MGSKGLISVKLAEPLSPPCQLLLTGQTNLIMVDYNSISIDCVGISG